MDHKPSPLRQPDPEAQARARTHMLLRRQVIEARDAMLPQVRAEGVAALQRLLPIARSDTGQSSVVARFLLNLYNGERFPFDMTDLRRLDYEVFDDCMAVLKMDFQPLMEVHRYFENGGAIWEALASDWGFTDYAGKTWR
jgi:hypothetical protein